MTAIPMKMPKLDRICTLYKGRGANGTRVALHRVNATSGAPASGLVEHPAERVETPEAPDAESQADIPDRFKHACNNSNSCARDVRLISLAFWSAASARRAYLSHPESALHEMSSCKVSSRSAIISSISSRVTTNGGVNESTCPWTPLGKSNTPFCSMRCITPTASPPSGARL